MRPLHALCAMHERDGERGAGRDVRGTGRPPMFARAVCRRGCVRAGRPDAAATSHAAPSIRAAACCSAHAGRSRGTDVPARTPPRERRRLTQLLGVVLCGLAAFGPHCPVTDTRALPAPARHAARGRWASFPREDRHRRRVGPGVRRAWWAARVRTGRPCAGRRAHLGPRATVSVCIHVENGCLLLRARSSVDKRPALCDVRRLFSPRR